ncbi:MAG: hypothetical protein RI973_1877 [Bacteroidota bacterium]|jgi:sialidase-1
MRNKLLASILSLLAWQAGSRPLFATHRGVQPDSHVVQKLLETAVFENGESSYQCFRIPALVQAPDGTLLAFAEGRRQHCGDFGDVDIVLKTSTDGGKTWSPLRVVANFDTLQAGNPAPVLDLMDPAYPNGRLFLFYNTGSTGEQEVRQGEAIREVWFTTSANLGESWFSPVNITAFVNRPQKPAQDPAYQFPEDWRSYANTPGHALQLPDGRLLVPSNHSAGPPLPQFRDYRAHAFFSDDHGGTWQLGADVSYPGSNESTAAALPDRGVLMSIRNQSGDTRQRLLARSRNGGATWDSLWTAADLPDPVCQGSLLNAIAPDGSPVLLHSNASSETERCCLTVKVSYNGGLNWKQIADVYSGSAAYSDLAPAGPGAFGVLYERDKYTRIHFAAFAWRQ